MVNKKIKPMVIFSGYTLKNALFLNDWKVIQFLHCKICKYSAVTYFPIHSNVMSFLPFRSSHSQALQYKHSLKENTFFQINEVSLYFFS